MLMKRKGNVVINETFVLNSFALLHQYQSVPGSVLLALNGGLSNGVGPSVEGAVIS